MVGVSSQNSPATLLRFANKGARTLSVLWVDYEGGEAQYASLEPGAAAYTQGGPVRREAAAAQQALAEDLEGAGF